MLTGNLSPEERLLRVIESGGEGRGPGGVRGSAWNIMTWPGRLLAYGERLKRLAQRGLAPGGMSQALSLTRINQGLVLVLVCSVAALVYNTRRPQPTVGEITAQALAAAPQETQAPALPTLRPLSEYIQEVEKRDLFALPVPKQKAQPKTAAVRPPADEPTAPPAPPPPPPPTTMEILRKKAENLKLVGISLGEPPLAMIEDKTNGKTYVVRTGETLLDLKVQSVSKKTVILGYRDARYELF